MKYNMDIVEKDLDNGLHVILVHKPDYVKSLFMLAAPVGGFDIRQQLDDKEYVHPSGCAHFLEHQMFRLHGKDVTDDFARMQAQTNAFTSYTETAYYFQTTADVKKPLSLLLDFVENLDITFDSVEKEKGIILSEYHMYDQNPEQRLLSNTWKALYKNHPLNTDILGTTDDISSMEVEQLDYFYRLNYDPARLTLVGITGCELEDIMAHIEHHQSHVSSQLDQHVQRQLLEEPSEVVQPEVIEYMDVTTPYVCVAYKLKPLETLKEAMLMDLSVQVRLDSLFSALNPAYQTWLDNRIISQIAFSECDFNIDHGYVLFAAQTSKVDEFISLVDEIVSELKSEIDESVFHAIQVRMVAGNIRGLDSFDGLAIDLLRSHFEGYDYFESLDYIRDLKKEDITALIQTLDFSNRSIVKILPKSSKTSNL